MVVLKSFCARLETRFQKLNNKLFVDLHSPLTACLPCVGGHYCSTIKKIIKHISATLLLLLTFLIGGAHRGQEQSHDMLATVLPKVDC